MKIRVSESQYNLLKALKEENEPSTTYVANFEILFNAPNEEVAKKTLETMKVQVSNATRNAEITGKLFQKVPFGGEPNRIV